MSIIVSEENFNQEVLVSSQTVIVHFWAPWCGLCHMVNPILTKLKEELTEDSIKLVAINADENLKLANTYSLKNLPTIIVFEQGRIQGKIDYFKSKDQFYSKLEEILKYKKNSNLDLIKNI